VWHGRPARECLQSLFAFKSAIRNSLSEIFNDAWRQSIAVLLIRAGKKLVASG